MNAIPAEYVLQPVTYRFPHYNDLSEDERELNKRERPVVADLSVISKALKRTAKIATEQRKITLEQAHKYFSSGLSRKSAVKTLVSFL